MSWKEDIERHVSEEYNDYEKYMRIAEEAEEDNHHCVAGVLRDIAHEEKLHMHYLQEMLDHKH